MITIAPSILACDFAHLADELQRAERAGADQIHIDVTDGRYVRDITMGPLLVAAVRRWTVLPLHVHLAIARNRLAVFTDLAFRKSAFWMMAIVVAIAWFSLITYVRAHFSMLRKGATAEAGQEE